MSTLVCQCFLYNVTRKTSSYWKLGGFCYLGFQSNKAQETNKPWGPREMEALRGPPANDTSTSATSVTSMQRVVALSNKPWEQFELVNSHMKQLGFMQKLTFFPYLQQTCRIRKNSISSKVSLQIRNFQNCTLIWTFNIVLCKIRKNISIFYILVT